MASDARLPSIDSPDDDPRLWLEEIEGDRATKWVAEENARAKAALEGPELDQDIKTLKEALDRPDRLATIARRGGLLYNFWKDAEHKRGVWRRTTMDNYRTENPEWDVLLNIDALVAAEKADWVWGGATTLPPNHDRAIIALSRGGSDAQELREFNMENRSFVNDGFNLPEAKSHIDWLDKDNVLLCSAFGGDEMITTSGYARTVRLWARGTMVEDAKVIYECARDHMSVDAFLDRTAPDHSERVIFSARKTFFLNTVSFGDRSGAKKELEIPEDAKMKMQGDHLLVRPRTTWELNGQSYSPDCVVAFVLSRFMEGKRTPALIFEPGPRSALQSMGLVAGSASLFILENLRPVGRIFSFSASSDSPSGLSWTEKSIEGLPEVSDVSINPLDVEEEESDGALLVTIETPIMPRSLSLSSVNDPSLTLLKKGPSTFDPTGLEVSRLEAVADDGERIPYYVVGPGGPPTGNAPVHLYAYGGFAITTAPQYNTSNGILWLAKGGICVEAQIRGGGEFGTRWHEAGRHEGKKIAQDDFAAVARDLVKREITKPERIAAVGASNGGLLIGNMYSRHPEDFGALLCQIPLVDMRRYTKLLAGASWIGEFGDPDKPEEWDYIKIISAYHADFSPAAGKKPPMLVTTTRRDDRVHPGHARKLAAKLKDAGRDTLFYEQEGGGHGWGSDNEQVAFFTALGYLFLRRAIGWSA